MVLINLKKICQVNKSVIVFLWGKISDNVYEHVLKKKTMKDYHNLHVKRDVSFLADMF